jgi:hypothetical protein
VIVVWLEYDRSMDRVVGIAVLVVSLTLLWTRIRHLEFGSFLTTVLSLLELLALGTVRSRTRKSCRQSSRART